MIKESNFLDEKLSSVDESFIQRWYRWAVNYSTKKLELQPAVCRHQNSSDQTLSNLWILARNSSLAPRGRLKGSAENVKCNIHHEITELAQSYSEWTLGAPVWNKMIERIKDLSGLTELLESKDGLVPKSQCKTLPNIFKSSFQYPKIAAWTLLKRICKCLIFLFSGVGVHVGYE